MSSPIREWPALMDLGTAGAYLTLAPGSLIALLRRENISPVDVGARLKRWRRQDLDELVCRLPRSWKDPDAEAEADEAREVASALEAVERRSPPPRQGAAGRASPQRRSREVRQSHRAP